MNKDRVRELNQIAARMRRVALEMVRTAGSGHIGGSFSAIELLTVLYFDVMRIDPVNPSDPGRDRFVLSKGHCTPALYSALAMRGYFPMDLLGTFRKIDGHLSGHAEIHVPGVDMSTGSLGQGASAALGMALAGKLFGDNYHVFAMLGDGELQEGQVWECAMAASAKGADNLTLIIDNNRLQLDGPVAEILSVYPIAEKFEAFGFHVMTVDGHDVAAIEEALYAALAVKGRPTVVIAETVKGKGVSFMENNVRWHGAYPSPEEFQTAFAELDAEIARWEGCA